MDIFIVTVIMLVFVGGLYFYSKTKKGKKEIFGIDK